MERLLNTEPFYNYDDFKKVCFERPDLVILLKNIIPDANTLYSKIRNKENLLCLIADDGLERLSFHKRENHRCLNNTFIDIYYFELKRNTGYLAFYKYGKKWTIKSFKINDHKLADISKSPEMRRTLKALGLSRRKIK